MFNSDHVYLVDIVPFNILLSTLTVHLKHRSAIRLSNCFYISGRSYQGMS